MLSLIAPVVEFEKLCALARAGMAQTHHTKSNRKKWHPDAGITNLMSSTLYPNDERSYQHRGMRVVKSLTKSCSLSPVHLYGAQILQPVFGLAAGVSIVCELGFSLCVSP